MRNIQIAIAALLVLTALFVAPVQAQPPSLEVWFAVSQENLDAVELLAHLAEETGFELLLNEIPLADLPTNLAAAAAAGTPPDLIITNHLTGTQLLAADLIDVYCLPGGCPECQSSQPPPWCPYARGNFNTRIGGEMLDVTQAWMSVDIGNDLTPYGVPLWWDYFPPRDFAGQIRLPVVVYGAYVPPNNPTAFEFLLWLIENEEVQHIIYEETGHLPVTSVSDEASTLLLDELAGLERVTSLPVPFLILPGPCIDFEDLAVGTGYVVGDTITSAGFDIEARDFQSANGTWHGSGFAEVDNAGHAGDSGNEMTVNNINLNFPLLDNLQNNFGIDALPTAVSLRFGEYGGNLNLDINGDFANFDDFANISGVQLGNVSVQAINGFGNDMGFLILLGQVEDRLVETFMLGGQELWIDDVCIQIYP